MIEGYDDLWICDNNEVVHPHEIIDFWANNTLSTIHICNS